jgi:DNA-binding FrmR family transcriptional regulator
MSQNMLTILTVAEIVALVVILAIYLLVVAGQLRSIAKTLQEVGWGARAVEKQLRAVRSNIDQINWAMEEVASTLPRVADGAERAGRGAVRS